MDCKLSGDIRRGAALRPKADLVLFDAAYEHQRRSCSWGAALEFRFGTKVMTASLNQIWEMITEAGWRWTLLNNGSYPICGRRDRISYIITHLQNSNMHGLSREMVANIVEVWEKAHGIVEEPRLFNPVYAERPEGEVVTVTHAELATLEVQR